MSTTDKGRQAFNFDLDTKVLKSVYGNEGTKYTQGYRDIAKALDEYCFEHRQGSGYVSVEPISLLEAERVTKTLSNRFPWLKDAVKKFDVTEVGNTWDLTHLIKGDDEVKMTDDLYHFDDLNDKENDLINEIIREYDLYIKTAILNDYYPSLLEQYINEKNDPDVDLIIDMYEGIIDEDEFIERWVDKEIEKGREL